MKDKLLKTIEKAYHSTKNSAKKICNLYPWETTTPDGDISPEEIVELCNMEDADTDRLVSGHRVPNQQ